jgi:hypothetical protein
MLGYATYTAAGNTQLFLAPNPILWTPAVIGTWAYMDGGGEYLISVPPASTTLIRISLNMPGVINTTHSAVLAQSVGFYGNGGGTQLFVGEYGPSLMYLEYGTTYATSEDLNVSQSYLLDSTAVPTPGPLQFSMNITTNLDTVNFTGLAAGLSFMSWATP